MALAIVYSLLCLIFITCNTIETKRLFNALNIYLVIWALMIVFYNFKLILYYDLSWLTWTIIFMSTIIVFLCYTVGTHCAKSYIKKHKIVTNRDWLSKKKLAKSILITSLIAACAIIPNIILLMARYGLNILSKTTQIYIDNVTGNAPFSIPYIGAIIYVSDVLAGIYFSQFGYKNIILIPILLSMLMILPSGSRGWLILAAFMFVFPCFLLKKPKNLKVKRRKARKNLLLFIITIILLGGLFILLTINRSQNLDPSAFQYMSPKMITIAKKLPWVYKLYQYFASPVGVLNEFLKAPEYYFGKNTFAVIYNFLNKFGLDINYSRYQAFYCIPIETNVGTWLLELTQDFGILGMFIVISSFSFAVGYFECMSNLCVNRMCVLWSAVLDTIFVMSFFVWYLREGTMVVILLSLVIINMNAYRKNLKLFKREKVLTN